MSALQDPKGPPLWRVWLDNPHYLDAPNVMDVDVHIENQGDVGDYVNWTLWVNTTTQRANGTLWVDAWTDNNSTYYLTANGTYLWDKGPGYYELLLEVEYYDQSFEAKSWFIVREVELEVWLVQDYYIEENDSVIMEVHIANSGDNIQDVNWSLWVNNTKRVGYTDFQVDANSENITFVPLTANLTYPWYKGPGYYDVYLNVSYHGKLYEAWCWFWVYGWDERVEVIIDFNSKINDNLITNYFEDPWEPIEIFPTVDNLGLKNITIDSWEVHLNSTPEYSNTTNFNITAGNFYSWMVNLTLDVWGVGYYEVELWVNTTSSHTYYAWCGFYVWTSAPPIYWLTINQSTWDAYYVALGESAAYNLTIEYYDFTSDTVNLSLFIDNVEVWNQTNRAIAPWDIQWELRSTVFNATGYYNLTFRLDSYYWGSWEVSSWLIVYDDWFIEAWIEQDYWTWLGAEAWFGLNLETDNPRNINLGPLNVTAWANGTQMYANDSIEFAGNSVSQSWWMDIYWNFTAVGYYDILLIVEWGGWYWEAYCWIIVEEIALEVWIDQPYYWDMDNPVPFDLYVQTTSDSFNNYLKVTLLANGSEIFYNPAILFDGYWDRFYIALIWEDFIPVDQSFAVPGYYDIELLVEYQGRVWSAWCYILIFGKPPNDVDDFPRNEPHAPISIIGNSQFLTQQFNELWTGSGTLDDPIIIAGYNITSSSANLIEISNTDLHFQISYCLLDGVTGSSYTGSSYQGIKFNNVKHAAIINNTIQRCSGGLFLEYISDTVISSNVIINGGGGIGVGFGTNNYIWNNTISNNNQNGIDISNSDNITLSANYFFENKQDGIHLLDSSNNALLNNTVSHNRENGIWLHFISEDNTVSGNIIVSNRWKGIRLDFPTSNNLVRWNSFTDNNLGASSQANDEGSSNIFEYNFWNDWTTPDADGDGLVDTPYPIEGSANNQDPYPRATPPENGKTTPTEPFNPPKSAPEESKSEEPSIASPGFELVALALAGAVLLGLRRRR